MAEEKIQKARQFMTYEEMSWQITPEKLAAIKNGSILTKPKMLIEEETGKFLRLVVPEGRASYYQELPLESGTIYALNITSKKKRDYRSLRLPPLESPYSLRTFSYNMTDTNYPPINLRQIHVVLTGLGRSYRWAITEESNNAEREAPHIVNLIFDQNKIIGAQGLNVGGLEGRKKRSSVAFFLLAPEERGRGLGKYLFDFTGQQAVSMGAESVLLGTSDQCTDSRNVCATNFYERQGWKIVHRWPFDYDLFKKGEAAAVPVTVPEGYFRDPNTGEELPRFKKELLELQLTKVARQLLSFSVSRPESCRDVPSRPTRIPAETPVIVLSAA